MTSQLPYVVGFDMLDIQLRPLKDKVFDPCCHLVPLHITPLHVTLAAFLSGLSACYAASQRWILLSLSLWCVNRALDCLDGALARYRKSASDLGGFLDLLSDFVVYSILPIAIVAADDRPPRVWAAVAVLEATFHVNNFILFYVAAILEKKQRLGDAKTKELTSVMMRYVNFNFEFPTVCGIQNEPLRHVSGSNTSESILSRLKRCQKKLC